MPDTVVLFDSPSGRWLRYEKPLRRVVARQPAEVEPALAALEAAVEGEGLHAAGFVAYEAAPGCDPSCAVADPGDFPLLWFGLYRPPAVVEFPAPAADGASLVWRAGLDAPGFARAVAAIKEQIAAGATYQVNFTFPLYAPFTGDPWLFFCALVHGQRAGQAAYLDTGRFVVCSASPELFFARSGERLTTRPMKGTAPRGRTLAEDRALAEGLQHSVKDRAENLMILDMLRNDLARLGGEVSVPALFTVEKYPTLWQLTSSAEARTRANLAEIFAALFPCASITGAPKLSTMQLIAALEDGPRRIYTGAIGRLAPGGEARFGVAIRTALIDREAGSAEYRVGAGITWGSEAAAEYRECLDKARILHRPMPDFALLESLRWAPGEGYWLLTGHLARLAESAAYFDYPFDREAVLARLEELAATLPRTAHKVRLLLRADGRLELGAELLEANPERPLRLALARQPVASDDPFLYHKTTCRETYLQAREAQPAGDEVLLWNERGELTEALNANLVAELDGRRVTPSVGCGLLPGTLRAQLLERGEITERVIRREELPRATRLWLINSVRGWREAELLPD